MTSRCPDKRFGKISALFTERTLRTRRASGSAKLEKDETHGVLYSYFYLLDEKSQFLLVRTDDKWSDSSSHPTFRMSRLQKALREGEACSG
ncbi:hypothetical protein PoB_004224400 [Plakobranchus ocellatus]|uniref:Uncharacterized protein n=1 Tax=Plakobranchus ocellatus TaxID=259542 RepID=A0AAV4B6L8_9GAST|nr:hypothetical protein PoB_004224400 [Plakobranchus ocellatus]